MTKKGRRQTDRGKNKESRDKKSVEIEPKPIGPLSGQAKKSIVARMSIASVLMLGVVGAAWFTYQSYAQRASANFAKQCTQAKAIGAWPQLELVATQWARWQPYRFEPWLYAAEAAQQLGDISKTVNYLSRMSDDAPVSALLILAELQFYDLNRPLAAIETCNRVLNLHPTETESHRRLLYLYAMTRQPSEIVREARRAIKAGGDLPETYVYLFSADWQIFINGYEDNQKWLQSDPGNQLFSVASIIHLVESTESVESRPLPPDAGDTPRAEYLESKLAQTLARFPTNREVLSLVLTRLCERGKVQEVADLLDTAPPESVNDGRFWRFKGWYHAAMDEWISAKEAFQRAIELSPYDFRSQHELAAVFRRMKEFEAVDAMQEKATLGKSIMREIVLVPSLDRTSEGTLSKLATYFETCGDRETANALRLRMQLSKESNKRP